VDKILQSIRTLLMDHLAASESLTVNLPLGGTTVKIPNTSRFRVGDEIYLISDTVGFAETSLIKDIPDDKTITIDPPSVRGWTVAQNSYIQKAVNHQTIKRIHIGDLKQIPSFPTITIDANNESNEWITLGQTSHNYKFSIRIYVLADNFERTNLFLLKLTKQTREILIDHIRPIIDGVSHPLTLDLPLNQTVVSIANTSSFVERDVVFLRDAIPRPRHSENYVKKILSSTDLELQFPAPNPILVSAQGELIKVNRLMYDTRPESIEYGYVKSPGGGPLMRASEISWYAKESILREGNIGT